MGSIKWGVIGCIAFLYWAVVLSSTDGRRWCLHPLSILFTAGLCWALYVLWPQGSAKDTDKYTDKFGD